MQWNCDPCTKTLHTFTTAIIITTKYPVFYRNCMSYSILNVTIQAQNGLILLL